MISHVYHKDPVFSTQKIFSTPIFPISQILRAPNFEVHLEHPYLNSGEVPPPGLSPAG